MGWKTTAKAAIESSYGTSKAGSASWTWLEFVSEGIESNRNPILSRALTQIQETRKVAPGIFEDAGALELELGPENACNLLYCAFGALSTTTLGSYTPNLYKHAFTLGDTLPSFELKMDTRISASSDQVIRHLCGITADTIGFTGAMDNFLMLSLGVRAQKEGPVDEAIGSPSFSTAMPFIPIDGSITIGGEAWTYADNFHLAISRNPHYRPRWGSQFIEGAAPGRAVVELSWNLYAESEQEILRFLGDYDDSMATRQAPEDVLESADIHINAENGEEAGTDQPFTFLLDLPRVIWTRAGPFIEGDGVIRQPMTGIAIYNSGDAFGVKCEIVNTLANASIIA